MKSYRTTTTQFIGRIQERALFHAWLDIPQAPLTIVTVTGISGVGKSTLLSEFIASEITFRGNPAAARQCNI